MKISASKKTITILSICFVLLLVGGFSFFYRDVISNGFNHGRWFVLDKYDKELPDYCEYEVGDGKVVVKCRGFLSGTPEGETPDLLCGDFQIVDKEGLGWKRFFPCLDYEDFSVHHILLKSGYYTPVDISIEYVKKGLFAYELDKISVEEMDYKEFYEIVSKNNKVNTISTSIATHNDIRYEEDGFLPLTGGVLDDYPYITYFKKLNLKEIGVKDGEVRLLFQGIIKDQQVTMEVLSKSFLFSYYNDTREYVDILVNTENYKKLPLNSSYQVHFFSLTDKEEGRLDEIIANCKNDKEQGDIDDQVFCNAGEEKIRNSVITDVYSYMDKLLLEEKKHIQPKKFILYSMYKTSE